MNNQRPAYCLKIRDFTPFFGFGIHARRSKIGAAVEELKTGTSCGFESEYGTQTEIRKLILDKYNGILLGSSIIGASFGLAGLAGLVSR